MPNFLTKASIRKRAYHRALKRGEPWAIMAQGQYRMADALAKELYKENPFCKLLGLKAWLDEQS